MKIYTQPTCAACKLLTKYLNEKGIEYEELTELPEGKYAVPLIEKDGQFIEGFNKNKIDNLLGIKSEIELSGEEKDILIKALNLVSIQIADPEGLDIFKKIKDLITKLQ